jgi:hypothetical protein
MVAGVVVSVPRLDSGDYPGDILDVSNAVLVVIENRSSSEVLIDPAGFTLGPVGGMQAAPIAPQALAFKQPAASPILAEGDMLAWHGGGGGGFHGVVGNSRVAIGGGVRVGVPGGRGPLAPGWHGGYYTPRSYYYGYNRWGWWAGGPFFWGATWGLGWYGSPWFWPWLYDGPRYYAWSRADAMRLALPAGRLPVGGRTGGFLYFPRLDHADGVPLVLQWNIREANTQQVLGTVQLPLEMRGD